jgi:threonine dehydratase
MKIEHYLKKILTARVYDVAVRTPLQPAEKLSRRLANRVLLKREDLQPVFSFKLRGAYNCIYQRSRERILKQVVTASAGNHAQGVALAAGRLGVRSLIVMPETTPAIKIDAVKALGAKILLQGDTYDDAYVRAMELARQYDCPFIHPYDDPDVIAGQGTVAMELLQQQQDGVDAVFVPVGGGGLIAGMAAYLRATQPGIRIIGVEPRDAASLYAALKAGRRVRLRQVGIFVDGVAVRQVGSEPFRIARQAVDEVVLVDTDEVCAAIKDIFEDTRSIAEPAGALAVAGIKRYVAVRRLSGKTLAAVVSGANMNFDRLRHVSERAELGEQREMLLAVQVPEKPGSFRTFCRALGRRSITEFNYRYADPVRADIFAGVELTNGERERGELLAGLRRQGFQVTDMSRNEMAKLHVRYMVGGHGSKLKDEYLLRLEFPERPGALASFLERLGQSWNISLFHYRNHGAAYGRVLMGVQIPLRERSRLRRLLDKLGYQYWDESGNPAYRLFLR